VRQGGGEGFHMPAGLVGLTVHTFQVEGGGGAAEVATLLDADIALNLEGFLFSARAEVTGSFDVGAVVAHEMGHALGIGHPCGDGFGAYPSCAALPEEVLQALEVGLMFPGQAVGARGLALTEEDAQGLIAVWGAQRVGVSEGSDRVGWRVCEEAGTLRLGEGAGGDVRWRAVTANGEGEWRASAATSPQEGAARGFLIAAQGRGSAWRGQEVVRCDNGDQDTSPEADARGVEDEGAREDVGVDDAEGVIPPQAEGESAAQEVSDGCGCRVQIGGREESGRAGEWAWLWIGAMSCLGWMLGWLRVGPKTGRGA
jgi:hypothetical protein